jgi:hypothetical protein
MRSQSPPMHIEPRWPVVIAILAVLFLLALLPDRVRAVSSWVPLAVAIAMILPMAAISLAGIKDFWLRIERMTTLAFFVIAGFGTAHNLEYLLAEMVRRSGEITGLQLLNSSIAVWISNVLIFSLAYWRTDRGGPEARANNRCTESDWLFPQTAREEGLGNWSPTFVHYLFIAFCTATAFSPTEALPLSPRAKLLMMLESMISLVTIVAVAARAINILGA